MKKRLCMLLAVFSLGIFAITGCSNDGIDNDDIDRTMTPEDDLTNDGNGDGIDDDGVLDDAGEALDDREEGLTYDDTIDE